MELSETAIHHVIFNIGFSLDSRHSLLDSPSVYLFLLKLKRRATRRYIKTASGAQYSFQKYCNYHEFMLILISIRQNGTPHTSQRTPTSKHRQGVSPNTQGSKATAAGIISGRLSYTLYAKERCVSLIHNRHRDLRGILD